MASIMRYTLDFKNIDLPSDSMRIDDWVDYYRDRSIIPEKTGLEIMSVLEQELPLIKIRSLKGKDEYIKEELLNFTDNKFSFKAFDMYELVNTEETQDLYDTFYHAPLEKNSNYILIVSDVRTRYVKSNHTLINMYCQYLKGVPADASEKAMREYAENLFFLNKAKLDHLIEVKAAARMGR